MSQTPKDILAAAGVGSLEDMKQQLMSSTSTLALGQVVDLMQGVGVTVGELLDALQGLPSQNAELQNLLKKKDRLKTLLQMPSMQPTLAPERGVEVEKEPSR